MISKTKLTALVKEFKSKEVDRALTERPDRLSVRDERGRNWLHLCCGVNPKRAKLKAEDSVKTAEVLLRRGLEINQEAFSEGDWRATPLWYAIARGENLMLAEFLLKRGSSPDYCLWAAAFVENLEAIRMLVRHGANINDPSVVEESPFLGAIKWSHFKSAEELLKLGADVNYQDSAGMTALHHMLKKIERQEIFRDVNRARRPRRYQEQQWPHGGGAHAQEKRSAVPKHGRPVKNRSLTKRSATRRLRFVGGGVILSATWRLHMTSSTDRIEKSVVLRAPLERVWRAISDSKQFGSWFGVGFDGPFVAGESIVGKMVTTTVDAEVAKRQEAYKGHRFEFTVDRIEPMRLFSFRWHPFAMDSSNDYSKEPSTLVVFQLDEVPNGTKLTVTESGFDQIPIERRAKAFAANEGGWAAQMKLIEKYLAQPVKG